MFYNTKCHYLARNWLDRLENALNPLQHHYGSVSTLQVGLIPEAPLAFPIVKQWVEHVLFNLNPNREELQGRFLTNFFKATTVGSTLDHTEISVYLYRLPCLRYQRHPLLDDNALANLVCFLKGTRPLSLACGACFFTSVTRIGNSPFLNLRLNLGIL